MRVYIIFSIAIKKKQLFFETIRYSDIGADIPILSTEVPILTQPTIHSTHDAVTGDTTPNLNNMPTGHGVDTFQPASSHSKQWRCDFLSGEDNSCCGLGKSDILQRWDTKLCEYYSWLCCSAVDIELSHPQDQQIV